MDNNFIKDYFPKTWKFISQKGSIKNFYSFTYNSEETDLINNKFISNKIDFINIEHKTPLHIYKTPYTFHGFSTNNILNNDLQYLNILEKLKNTLFAVKIKLIQENNKFNLVINRNDFRIPILAVNSFNENLPNFELRFAYYLKLLLDYEYLTYEIIYKDAAVSVPYWTFVALPISYVFFKDSPGGEIYRTVVTTLLICMSVAAIISLYIHNTWIANKLKDFGYYEKYYEAKEIIHEDDFNFGSYFNQIKNDLKFLKNHIRTPLTENQNLIIQENFVLNKISSITEVLDEVISKNINHFLPYLI